MDLFFLVQFLFLVEWLVLLLFVLGQVVLADFVSSKVDRVISGMGAWTWAYARTASA